MRRTNGPHQGAAYSTRSRRRAALNISLSLAAAGLSACASHPQLAGAPTLSPAQEQAEAADYRAHAKPRYQPPGPPGDPWSPYIFEASRRFDVPDVWIREVMRVESAGYEFRATGELTTSPVGAMGLMQLMPETYDAMRIRDNLGTDAYEPHDNILAGTAYLREMYDAFGAPAFLAAYNAGPQRLQDYLVHNKPLPDETRRYVRLIGPRIVGIWPVSRSPAEQLAVNQLPLDIPPGPRWIVHHTSRTMLASARRTKGHHVTETRYAALHVRGHGHQSAPIEVAELPEPRQPHQSHPATRYADAGIMHASLHHAGFHIISPAMASDRAVLSGHNWGIQVGAYANRALAVQAAGSAHGLVSHASMAVAPTQHGHAVVYRARLAGMTHEDAVAACHRVSHHGACLLVSPASQ
jgi:hypothetical protein